MKGKFLDSTNLALKLISSTWFRKTVNILKLILHSHLQFDRLVSIIAKGYYYVPDFFYCMTLVAEKT